MQEERKESLLPRKKHLVFDDVSQPVRISPAKGQQSVHSALSNQTNPVIYDLPDMGNITKGVMCKLMTVSVVCIIFLGVEVPS
jgi:hypothetical protein